MVRIKSVVKLFEKSGDVGPQPNLLKLLKDNFVSSSRDEFFSPFKDALMSVIISQTTIHCVVVNNMIKFAANGVSVLCEHSTNDGSTGLHLISEIFRLCRNYGNANDKAIRWRFCLFLNHLLNYMSDGTVLAVELCDVATLLLLERLQDKKPEIRAQAAHALHRLQTPDNPKCKVVEKFLFHMTCDPSIEVRTAIVKVIAMFNHVVEEILSNTLHDVSDNVRKEAYNRLLAHPFLSFTSKQRQTILVKGLEDKNEHIKSLIKKRLLNNWLESCNDDFVLLLKHLGVENESLCERTLNIMFEYYYDSQVLDLTNAFLNSDSRMIDFDQLTVEKIFLWKCVAKYLTTEKKIELARNQGHSDFDDNFIDVLLPDLVKFSDYVRHYYFVYDSKENKEFILSQLLDMARTFSIDDVGAESLNKLCYDLILDDQTSIEPIKPIAVLLDFTFKIGEDVLNYAKKILNEIQTRTIDAYPIIEKVGKKELLEHELASTSKSLDTLLPNMSTDSEYASTLIVKMEKIKKKYKLINVSSKEATLVDIAVKNLLKGFELAFQIQQLPKVGVELSLLTDIIQNIIVVYLECSLIKLRMGAIRSLSPYLLANNVAAAKEHMITLCGEIANPLTDRHLLFKIMFELFLRYDLKTFDMKEDLDTDENYEDMFCVDNILPLLASCIDYEVDDNSFKSVVVKGFCDLLLFEKVKSINLLSKLLIIWFRRLSRETFNISNNLVQFFTSYVFYICSSSSTLAKCYVPVLKEIEEHDLTTKLDINTDEVNSTLINITRGLMFKSEKLAVNAHGELAGYILDYLLEEDQPYTTMLVDTLCKLEICFEDNDELICMLGPKLKRVIKYFKQSNEEKNSGKCLKKITHKFDPVLQKQSSLLKKRDKKVAGVVRTEKEEPQAPVNSTQNIEMAEIDHSLQCKAIKQENVVHGDLFPQELAVSDNSDDEDSIEAFTKLDAMKRMSEIFKKSFNTKSGEHELISDSD